MGAAAIPIKDTDIYNNQNNNPGKGVASQSVASKGVGYVSGVGQRVQTKTAEPPAQPKTTYVQPTNSGGGGGGGGGGSSFEVSKTDYESELLAQIRAELEAQKKALDEQAKTAYEQRLAQNTEAFEGNRNQINRNYMRTNNYLNQLYGDAVAGQGLSNRNRNYQNWNNNLTSNDKNYANNNSQALADYNAMLSNNSGTYTQGLYNYVMPVMTNRQNYDDSLINQRNLQALDLDYRKYLAGL